MARYIGRMAKRWAGIDNRMRGGFRQAVRETADVARAKFEAATLKWKNKPKWITRLPPVQDRNMLKYEVVAIGSDKVIKIWGYVDKGTEPHIITPKKPGGVLAFNVGYEAKTSPVANANVGSGIASGKRVMTQRVNHPGNEPREFSGYFALEAEETLIRKINAVIRVLSRRRI